MKTNLLKSIFLPAAGMAALMASQTARADYPSTVLADSPAAYWRFSEANLVTPVPLQATNRGTVGAGGNGSYVGSVVRGVSGVVAGSKATSFSGGAWVNIPNSAALNPNPPFSVEYWIKPNPVAGGLTCPISSTDFVPTPRLGWLFYTDAGYSSGYVNYGYYFRVYSTGGTLGVSSTAGLLTTNWTHVVGTVDGTNIVLYVNGQEAGHTTWSGTFTPNVNQPIGVGARYDAGFPQDGTLNEFAIYGSALSAKEIKAHFDAATTNGTGYSAQILAASPAGYWRLNEPVDVVSVAANSSSRGAAANGVYHYWSSTTADLDSPAYPGFEAGNTVFNPSGTNGIVTVPALNLNTNTVTFESWIKRNGSQTSYAGVLFHRGSASGTASGLDFHDVSDNLGYHWNDQANTYGWVSGLSPADGVWTYVALTISPSQAVLYTYDGTTWGSAVNVVDHPVQAFDATTRIGSDSDTSRYFNGSLDEAAIYASTLSEGQVRTHALAGFGDPTHSKPVFVSDPPAILPGDTIYSTTQFSLFADAYGEPPLAFQWQHDGTNLPGATTRTFTRASASTSDSGNYTIIVSNANGYVTSSVASVTVNSAVPPTLSQQPASRATYAGGNASFTVIVDGTTPLKYQWRHAGTNLPGATNITLWITNVDATVTGAYSVAVTNVAGNIVSSSATLSISAPPANSYDSAVVGYGPIAYWPLNETSGSIAFDPAGGYDSTHQGGVSVGETGPRPPGFPGFTSGNDAVLFDGTVSSSSSSGVSLLNNRTNFTLSGWINPSVVAQGGFFGQNDVVEFRFSSATAIEFWTKFGSISYTVTDVVIPGNWYFLTAVGTSNTLKLYINGQAVATATSTAASGYGTSTSPFLLSGNTSGNNDPSLNGLLDAVAVYPRALSDIEIGTLYAAGAYGTTTPPLVTADPSNQFAEVGGSATLAASVSGSLPITYQWKKEGVTLAGATSATLIVSNAYFTDGGSYVLWATNAAGYVKTAAATLTILPAPTFANLTNGLVLHLSFDGNYTDSSKLGNNGEAVGSPTFIPGKIGQAVHIATTPGNNYVTVSDSTGDLGFDETTSFSISFWVNYTSRFNDTPIIGTAINSTYQLGWVFTDTAGKLEWSLVSTANSGTYLRDPVPNSPVIGDGNWHHILGVVDRQKQTAFVYVDGILSGSWSIAGLGTLNNGNTITIGQDPTGNYGSATFDLDDLGIWRRALTSYEAASVYGAAQKSGESFDVYGPVKLGVKLSGTNVEVNWQAGTLLQSTNASGPYVAVPGAAAPFYRTPAAGSAVYFRVKQ